MIRWLYQGDKEKVFYYPLTVVFTGIDKGNLGPGARLVMSPPQIYPKCPPPDDVWFMVTVCATLALPLEGEC